MIRSARYKYTSYLEGSAGGCDPSGGEELYDLQEDRGEMVNLASDPTHRATLLAHRALLQDHLRKEDDPFYSYDVVVDERWRSHEAGYTHHRGGTAVMALNAPS